MTLAPSSPTAYPPPRRKNGCLWGCLIVMLLVSLPPILVGGYGAWFLWQGYRRDPVLRVVGEMVREVLLPWGPQASPDSCDCWR
jgi:hypothetical protein